jgi:hypothetical protein
MHSVYWVLSRDCNQKCPHCYNDSAPHAPGLTLEQASRVIANLPDPARVKMPFVWISGGEPLVWPELLFHALGELYAKYGDDTEFAVQTNGDLLDDATVEKLLAHHVSRISIASVDDFHKRSTRERAGEVAAMLERHGCVRSTQPEWRPKATRVPQYNVWGCTEDLWIGKIWPRGRAMQTGLTKCGPEDNFCGNWSGAIGFLDYTNDAACQVNIQLADVYPCCPMTCRPIGDISREPLTDMLDRCAKHPVYRALNEGKPEKMGEYMGLSEQYGIERTKALGNHCLWCDEFFTKHATDLLHHGAVTERGTKDLLIDLNVVRRKKSKPVPAQV